jgi:hypothetical protein
MKGRSKMSLRQSSVNKIYSMTLTNRQSFKKDYPTAESLADAIQQVFTDQYLAQARKEDEARLEELRPLFTKPSKSLKKVSRAKGARGVDLKGYAK